MRYQEFKFFQEAKESLTSSSLFIQFDPRQKVVLSYNASSHEMGAVLLQKCS